MTLTKRKTAFFIACAIAFAATIGAALAAQSIGGGFDLTWHTFDGGGGISSNATYTLHGTIGQPDAGPPMTGGSFEITGGFWPAVGVALIPCPPDITGDGLIDVSDLLLVINSWGNCPAPPATCPADINGSNTVDVSDLLAVISAWGVCP